MGQTAGHILKGSNVKIEGQFQLGTGQTTTQSAQRPHLATPQANIIENNPQFAIIEITCSCGEKNQIRCEYPNTQADNQAPEQTQ